MRDTVGSKSRELMMKDPETRDPIELEREMQQNYLKDLKECIDRGKKAYQGPFFVVVINKKEPLMPNVIRQYFLHRQTCPRSDYDQSVFRFDPKSEMIDYLWTVPDKETCMRLKTFALEVDKTEHELRNMVIDFYDGTLDRRAGLLNNEPIEGISAVISVASPDAQG